MIKFQEETSKGTVIKVIGVGGAGGNAVDCMISEHIKGVEFIVANTDAQALDSSSALTKVQIGSKLTKGQGAGAKPEVGRAAAIEDRETLRHALEGADMVFITCGLGGGTGTGASPIIAELCKEMNALTVAVVTKPFVFEGRMREKQAIMGLSELQQYVNTSIVIPNQRLYTVLPKGIRALEAFSYANSVLVQAVRGISDLITIPGYINVDFADVRTIMLEQGGSAVMGMGMASGEDRALKASQQAIASPLLADISIEGARGILVNMTSGSDMTLTEMEDVMQLVNSKGGDTSNIIFGTAFRENCDDFIVTVVATGFGDIRETLPVLEFKPEMRMPEPITTGAYYIPPSEDPLMVLTEAGFGAPSSLDDFATPTFMRKRPGLASAK